MVRITKYNWQLSASVIGIFALILSTIFVRKVLSQNSVAQIPAYTLLFNEKAVNTKTGATLERHLFYARRSDGAHSEGALADSTDESKFAMRKITLPSQGVEYNFNDAAAMRFTVYLRPPSTAPPRSVNCTPNSFSGMTYSGAENVVGMTAQKYQRAVTDPTRVRHEQIWYAPSLNCRPIQQIVDAVENSDGSISDHFERVPQTFTIGDPEPSLFNVPNYSDVLPSELHRAIFEIRHPGTAMSPKADTWLQLQDKAYYDSLQFKH